MFADVFSRFDPVLPTGRRRLSSLSSYPFSSQENRKFSSQPFFRKIYDPLNRLSTLTENNRTTTYGYDLNGNLTGKWLPNNDVEAMTYDALNRITGEQSTSGSTIQYGYYYKHDLAGNLSYIQEHDLQIFNQTQTFLYDGANRLKEETSDTFGHKSYGYDAANNRISLDYEGYVTTYTPNAVNELIGFDDHCGYTVAFTYDNNGNRLTRTCGGLTDTYAYDLENRLTSLTKADNTSYVYTYDYRTRRIERIESNPEKSTDTQILFSGGVSVKEFEGGFPTVEYIRGHEMGGGVGGILYTNRSGKLSFDHYNSRGDVVAKTDINGANTYQVWYDAFGNRPAFWCTDDSVLKDRQQANTKEEDPTGLVLQGFRYTSLEDGTFINRDPIGNTLMMPEEKWIVDGREVSAQEYQEALEPGVVQAGNGPIKTAKDSGVEADCHMAGSEETRPKNVIHMAAAGFPNLYTYVNQNPWTFFDAEGLYVTYRTMSDEQLTAFKAVFAVAWQKSETFQKEFNTALASNRKIEIGPSIDQQHPLSGLNGLTKLLPDEQEPAGKIAIQLRNPNKNDVGGFTAGNIGHELQHANTMAYKGQIDPAHVNAGDPRDPAPQVGMKPNQRYEAKLNAEEDRGKRVENMINREVYSAQPQHTNSRGQTLPEYQ